MAIRRRRKWEGDPMESVSPAVLRAVLRYKRMTVSELALKSKNSQQTLSNLAQGYRFKRCRLTRLKAIARVLGTSPELLRGHGFARIGKYPFAYEFLYSTDTMVAARYLLERCAKASERDVAAWKDEVDRHPMGAFVVPETIEAIGQLISLGHWRERLITWRDRHPRQGYREPLAADINEIFSRPAEDPAHEEATLALIHSIEHILTPWFEGRAQLNYRVVLELTNTPLGGDPSLVNPLSILPMVEPNTQPKESRQ